MKDCDLIMKGGVTSGVVYPRAIRAIADDYRLCSIGGTSAGALAAVLAAAAEYRRAKSADGTDKSGFDRIVTLSRDLANSLIRLFQPDRELAPLFQSATNLIAANNSGRLAVQIAKELLFRFPWDWGFALLRMMAFLGALYLCSPFEASAVTWIVAAGGLLALWFILLCRRLYRLVFEVLPARDFGICSGLGSGANAGEALVNWLDNAVQEVAGEPYGDEEKKIPLTVRTLRSRGIELAAMTTDLSSGRPYQLPLQTSIHYFSEREFKRLFPEHVVEYLVGGQQALTEDLGEAPRDLYQLPVGDDFPILLLARMSLSFPILFQTVPLYRRDYGLRRNKATDDAVSTDPASHENASVLDSAEKSSVTTRPGIVDAPLRRCLFSDGGLSSNFPVHFFDSLLPSRPTFGISLAPHSEERHGNDKFHLPSQAPQSTALPVTPPDSLPAFFGAMFNTSRTWSDTLQSMLPSYAERTVEVRLTSAEGGLNLTMNTTTIDCLIDRGGKAGAELVQKFDFDEHRYLRAVAMLPVMEGALEKLAENYAFTAEEVSRTYEDILTTHAPKSFKNTAHWRKAVLAKLAGDLAALGVQARDNANVRSGDVPVSDAEIRYVADADRVPRSADQ
ncbi:MAG: hypothetical protein AAF458_00180 [Pseudomonadota bacterium]